MAHSLWFVCQEIVPRRTRIPFLVLGVATALALVGKAYAQSDCEHGVVHLLGGVNGNFEICPALASQAPQLQRQLTEFRDQIANQQAQLKQLTQMIKDLNSVSENIGLKRQSVLVKTFSGQLSTARAGGSQQTQKQIADLADRLENLKDVLLEKLSNRATANQTNAALDGQVGDEIAKLNLPKAQSLLEDIHAQLKELNSKVDQVHGQTTEIQATLAREEAEAKNAAIARQNDPQLFAKVMVTGMSHSTPATSASQKWQITASIMGAPPDFRRFTNPTVQLAFRNKQESWLVNVTNRQSNPFGENFVATIESLGDTAVLCLIAPDFTTGTRREWTQRYTVEQQPKGNFSMAAFVPAGLPSLSAADDKPCDGATQVRQSVPQMSQQEVIEAAQEHAAQTVTAHLAEQEKMKSDITRFGIIAISASKQVKANSGNWELEVRTAPSPVNQGLYDINVQVIRKDVAGTAQEVPFSDTETQSPWEVRRATLSDLGKVVVVCLSGRSPGRPTPLRLRHEYRVIVPQTASVSSAASAIFMLDGVPTLTSLPNPTAPCQ